MQSSLSNRTLAISAAVVAVLAGTVAWLLYNVPAVEGLGNRVKLPLFHGGSTWVDLMIFTLMGIAAAVFLVNRSDRAYAWEVGFRAVAAPLWAINSVLGYIAAMSTWDLTGSKESPFVLAMQDARLKAQVILLLVIVIVLLLDWLILERRFHKAIADLTFVIVMWIFLANIFLDPVKAALHPNNPVLNSGWEIKGPFLGMVAAMFVMAIIIAWVISTFVGPEKPAETLELAENPA
jgi:hypothetical protein